MALLSGHNTPRSIATNEESPVTYHQASDITKRQNIRGSSEGRSGVNYIVIVMIHFFQVIAIDETEDSVILI